MFAAPSFRSRRTGQGGVTSVKSVDGLPGAGRPKARRTRAPRCRRCPEHRVPEGAVVPGSSAAAPRTMWMPCSTRWSPRSSSSQRGEFGDGAVTAPLGEWSLEATILVWGPGQCPTPSPGVTTHPGLPIPPPVETCPLPCRPLESAAQGPEKILVRCAGSRIRRLQGRPGRACAPGSRCARPARRSCLSAKLRPRPASGTTMPAQSPSARGNSQASRAHSQRRGHSRQMTFA